LLYDALGMSTAGNGIRPHAPGEVVSEAATVNARQAIKIERSVTINRPRAELYALWRNFETLPNYLDDIISVTVQSNARSHWVAEAPGGKRVEWDSEIVNDIPNELIAWKTVGNSDIAHAGSVNFRDAAGNRGTEIKVEIDYEPPGGRLGAVVASFARLFGQEPDAKVREDLRKFKMRMETGEVATIDGQPTGRSA
jgi:uncharacterized membrane protein